MKKKLTVFVCILILLLFIGGISYAFFIGVVKKNENTIANINSNSLKISFIDGSQIIYGEMVPGQKIIKTFSVTNTGNQEISYSINLIDVVNELSRYNDLVYTLTSTNDGAATNGEVSFPTSDSILFRNVTIGSGVTQNYTLVIDYKNLAEDQSVDMGSRINATIQINEAITELAAGLYDSNDNLIASYDTLVSTYNFNPSANYEKYIVNRGKLCVDSDDLVTIYDNEIPTCVLYHYANAYKLILPDTVTSIGNYAFYDSTISEIVLSNSVISIGDDAFRDSEITDITLPDGLVSIGEYAFSYLHNLRYLNIPNSVETIGEKALSVYCPVKYDGNSFTPDDSGAHIKSFDNFVDGDFVYEDSSKTKLISYIGKDKNVVIPSTVTSIGEYAFYYKKLSSVVIPSSVTSIGESAFYYTYLPIINVPSSVNTIGSYAFQTVGAIIYNGSAADTYNNKWGASTLNPYIDGDFAYSDSSKTTLLQYLGSSKNVVVPNTVTTIGDRAFSRNYFMDYESIILPNGLLSIGERAFIETNLKSLTVPDSVTSIKNGAFIRIGVIFYSGSAADTYNNKWGAYALNPFIEDGFVYEDNTKTILLRYIGNDKNIVIPNTVTTIKNGAFYNVDFDEAVLSGNWTGTYNNKTISFDTSNSRLNYVYLEGLYKNYTWTKN